MVAAIIFTIMAGTGVVVFSEIFNKVINELMLTRSKDKLPFLKRFFMIHIWSAKSSRAQFVALARWFLVWKYISIVPCIMIVILSFVNAYLVDDASAMFDVHGDLFMFALISFLLVVPAGAISALPLFIIKLVKEDKKNQKMWNDKKRRKFFEEHEKAMNSIDWLEFDEYVCSHYSETPGEMNADQLISKRSNSDEEAFDKYIELLGAFIKERGIKGRPRD